MLDLLNRWALDTMGMKLGEVLMIGVMGVFITIMVLGILALIFGATSDY